MKCIYCESQGPFTDEHVVSAGLGGDDRNWLLKGCVCRVCNTEIFSKLETKLLKASAVAVARLFVQPRTRSGTPSTQPKASYHYDPASRLLLEAKLAAGGAPEILPQLIAKNVNEIAITGPNSKAASDLLTRLKKFLAADITLIEKVRSGFEVEFRLIRLNWDGEGYSHGEVTVSRTEPADGIWQEPLVWLGTAEPDAILSARIFAHATGQVVARTQSANDTAGLLTVLRHDAQALDPARVSGVPVEHMRAGIHQRFLFDYDAFDRVLAKIGINLCAKILGVEFVQSPVFDATKRYVRDGVGGIYKHSPEHAVHFADVLGGALPNRHVFGLMNGPMPNGKRALVFLARLYGGPMDSIRLAEFDEPIVGLEHPIMVHVDYVNHVIEQLTLEEHASRIVESLGPQV